MLKATQSVILAIAALAGPQAVAQNPYDNAMTQINRLQSLAPTDEGTIRDWVTWEFERLSAAGQPKAFMAAMAKWRDDAESTAPFKDTLAREVAARARTVFGDAKVPAPASVAVATSLAAFGARAPMDALLAGLRSPVAGTRFLMARSVASRRAGYGTNAALLGQVSQAVVTAATSESEPAVLTWMYECLVIPGRANDANVLGPLLTVFKRGVQARRQGAAYVDGADFVFLEYIRPAAGSLPANERNQLLPDLAAYLRLVGERYLATDLKFPEQVNAERALDATEAVLQGITGTAGGVRAALAQGDRDAVKDGVRQAIEAWVGNEATAGVLNGGSYNVPRGAP